MYVLTVVATINVVVPVNFSSLIVYFPSAVCKDLPPGTTDQDFHILQSPINGNGDLILLAGAEIGRLFFCGEHTTALHPSMAHGAMLSGYRAAQEVVDAMRYSFQGDEAVDRSIPLSLFRLLNPGTTLQCSLCHLPGTRLREGSLLAFKRGSRNVLCHNNCAENCPEVEVNEGVWKNVIKACNRGRLIDCYACGRSGASIGCGHEHCLRSYHFSCAEDTGWRFDSDGKEFLCDQHWSSGAPDSRRISMGFYLYKMGAATPLVCSLCGMAEDSHTGGELLAFQQSSRRALAHKNCARYTNIMDISENEESRSEYDFRNIIAAIDQARYTFCSKCGGPGATIRCTENECSLCFHYQCTEDWNFDEGASFRCFLHRQYRHKRMKHLERGSAAAAEGGIFQHALFSSLAEAGSDKLPASTSGSKTKINDSDPSQNRELGKGEKEEIQRLHQLTCEFGDDDISESRLVRVQRPSLAFKWNVSFLLTSHPTTPGRSFLTVVHSSNDDPYDGLVDGDAVCAINGTRVGSSSLDSIEKVIKLLRQEVEVLMEVRSKPRNE
jgi:Flavin containing amine oxidoreductase/PHD-like zinc-binding domain/PHD-zinc-finger like domain